MNDTPQSQKPHSWEYFGEARDFWWNLDFLELMAVRLKFDQVGTVFDAGCGIGHWGQLLARVLPPQTGGEQGDLARGAVAPCEQLRPPTTTDVKAQVAP